MTTPEQEVDRMIDTVLRTSSAGVDLDTAALAIQAALEALTKQAQALSRAKYGSHHVTAACLACGTKTRHKVYAPAPDVVARAAAHTVKVVDETVRLVQFAKGQPDSRPDLGNDWLRALSDEQVRTVQGWIATAGGAK